MNNNNNQICCHLEGRVLHIELNRPEKKNALTAEMYSALTAAILDAEKNSQIRCLLLYGAGDCFTSGNDLKDFSDPSAFVDGSALLFLQAAASMEKPLIAAVHGLAIGIGTTLLLHCDLVYAAENTRFQMPFVALGLVPEGGASYLLPRLVGPQKAAELILLSESFDAHQAAEFGLVNRCLDQSELLRVARQKADALAEQPPAAVRLSKAMLKSEQAQQVQMTLLTEARKFEERLGSPEAKEAFTAFFEKRAADFSAFE